MTLEKTLGDTLITQLTNEKDNGYLQNLIVNQETITVLTDEDNEMLTTEAQPYYLFDWFNTFNKPINQNSKVVILDLGYKTPSMEEPILVIRIIYNPHHNQMIVRNNIERTKTTINSVDEFQSIIQWLKTKIK